MLITLIKICLQFLIYLLRFQLIPVLYLLVCTHLLGGSVAEWLACWTQAQKARVQIAVATLSVNKLLTPIVPLLTKQQNW